MILQGPAPASLPLSEPKLITSLADAEDLGITADYDTDNGLTAHEAIKQFYAGAGTGKRLWIMVVSQAVAMTTMLDQDEDYAVKLLDAAAGAIRMLTVVRDPAAGYAPTITGSIDEDVTNAITTGQALAEAYAADYKPLRVILPAYGYDGDAGTLVDLKQRSDNRVAVVLGGTASAGKAAVGVLLGRLAADPVQRNPGRVKSDALPILKAYIGSETVEAAGGDVGVIHDKGFITLRKHTGLSGYFFTDDPTATKATDDYSSLARGRVIDKAIFITYRTYVQELLDEILVNATTGRISVAQSKYLQQRITSAINTAMTATGEIVAVEAQVDPTQNILSTGKICVDLRITPYSYARTIEVTLGFTNPANS
jgi:hypothetical protein